MQRRMAYPSTSYSLVDNVMLRTALVFTSIDPDDDPSYACRRRPRRQDLSSTIVHISRQQHQCRSMTTPTPTDRVDPLHARVNPTLILISFVRHGVVSFFSAVIHGNSNGVDLHHDYNLTNTSTTFCVTCWTPVVDACSSTRRWMNNPRVITWSQWSCVLLRGFDCVFAPAVLRLVVEYLGIAAIVVEEDHGEGLIRFLGMSVG